MARRPGYHLLTTCSLKAGVSSEQFEQALAALVEELVGLGLLQGRSAIGRRHRHEIMDTDTEREHDYAFILSFRDRAQCDAAVRHITAASDRTGSTHSDLLGLVRNPIFSCWET